MSQKYNTVNCFVVYQLHDSGDYRFVYYRQVIDENHDETFAS